jgi:rhodanese-related sulfurtransferase
MVDEATRAVRSLSVDEGRALHGRPDVRFVDLRESGELRREGVIPGALHAPRGVLEFRVDPESPWHDPAFAGDPTLVLFCAIGWRSALAAQTLQQMGFDKVAHLAGGFEAWKAGGAPVADKPPGKAPER